MANRKKTPTNRLMTAINLKLMAHSRDVDAAPRADARKNRARR